MFTSKNLLKSAAYAGLMVATLGSANAQQKKEREAKVLLKVDKKAKFEDLKTPDFTANTKIKKFTQKEWLEMEVKFKVDKMLPLPKDKTLPKLTVKWYVAIVNPNAKGRSDKYLRLTQEIQHVNIPVGEDIYTSVYISPSGVRRLSNGGDRASKKQVFAVGGEFLLNGKVVKGSRFSSIRLDKRKLWWEDSNLSESKSIKLHNKNETPFKFLWTDRYAEIETETNKAMPAAEPAAE